MTNYELQLFIFYKEIKIQLTLHQRLQVFEKFDTPVVRVFELTNQSQLYFKSENDIKLKSVPEKKESYFARSLSIKHCL